MTPRKLPKNAVSKRKTVKWAAGTKMSLDQSAAEFGLDPKTLKSRLMKNGVKCPARALFTIKVIHENVQSTMEKERIADMQHARQIRERKEAERMGDLISFSEARKLLAKTTEPVRQAFLSLAADCAAKCNPGDPDAARLILDDWAKGKLAGVREAIDKP